MYPSKRRFPSKVAKAIPTKLRFGSQARLSYPKRAVETQVFGLGWHSHGPCKRCSCTQALPRRFAPKNLKTQSVGH